MDARGIGTLHAVGRVVVGASMTLQPRRASAVWVGRSAHDPGTQVLSAAMGVRDAAIGAGILLALHRGEDARPWVAGGIASDFVDLVATVIARRSLPAAAVAGVVAVATSSVAAGGGSCAGSISRRCRACASRCARASR